MSVVPRAEIFNIVSNDQGCTHKCDFSFSDRKYPFLENLVQNIKIVGWSWNLIAIVFRIYRIQWWSSLFPFFWLEIPFLGKFVPKNQNCHFQLKFGTYSNSNMQNSMVMFISFVFDWKCPFSKFRQESQNYQLKLKIGS